MCSYERGREREEEREGGRREGGKERMRMFIHIHCQVYFAPLEYLPHVAVNTIGFRIKTGGYESLSTRLGYLPVQARSFSASITSDDC